MCIRDSALLGEPVVEAGKGFMGEIAQLPRPEPLVGSLGSNARLHEPPIGAVEVLLDRRGREHGQTLGRALKVAKKRKRPQAAPRRAEKLLASDVYKRQVLGFAFQWNIRFSFILTVAQLVSSPISGGW